MKKKGSKSDYAVARNAELCERFRELLRTSRGVTLRDLFGMAAQQPASRFWISERAAYQIVSRMLRAAEAAERGTPIVEFEEQIERMYPMRRRMCEEIARRVKAFMAEEPGLCLAHAVDRVVTSPAPEFYLTPESSRYIIYAHRRRQRALSALQSKIIKR